MPKTLVSNPTTEINELPPDNEPPMRDEGALIEAIKGLLAEDKKALPGLIRAEIGKMMQEARAGQPIATPQQPVEPQNGEQPRYETPPTTQQPPANNVMAMLAQAAPAVMQMLNGQQAGNDMSAILMQKVVEAGLNNMTLGSRFLDAIVTMTTKNLGAQFANQATAQVAAAVAPT